MAHGQYAILVDAGYLYACSGRIVLATTTRRDFRVDTAGFVAALMATAAERVSGRLLRVYWFDAAKDRIPTLEQRAVAGLAGVKLRLGNLNHVGQQKGVDAQIRADLEALSRNHAITDAILVAGDEDMLPAVEAAQAHGVRLHLWGIEPPYGSNQAERLVWEADERHTLDEEFCRPYVHRNEATRPAGPAAPATAAIPTPMPNATLPAGAIPAPALPSTPRPVPTPLAVASMQAPLAVRAGAVLPSQIRAVPVAPALDLDRIYGIGEEVAHRWLYQRGRDNLAELLADAPRLPTVLDRDLLVEAEGELGETLRGSEEARRRVRDGFWARLYREFAPDAVVQQD